MAALHSSGHYIFVLFFLSSFFPHLISAIADWMSTILFTHGVTRVRISNAGLKCAALGSLEIQDPKNRHLCTIAQLRRAISLQLRHVSTIGKNLLNSNVSPTCPHNMMNFGPLVAEICWWVWGTPANFNAKSCEITATVAQQCVSVSFRSAIWH